MFFKTPFIKLAVYRYLISTQLVISFLAILGCYAYSDYYAAIWSAVACFIVIVAHFIFGIKMFQYRGATQLRNIFSAMIFGWALKLLFFVVGFILVFLFIKQVYVIYFLISLIVISFSPIVLGFFCKSYV